MKYYIVTGTTKGIGKGVKELLLEDPTNFIFTLNRSIEPEDNTNLQSIKCNVGVNSEIENAFGEIMGKIDKKSCDEIILINNAGVVDPIKFIHNSNPEDIEKCFDINVLGTINTTRCFLKAFSDYECSKKIVNISSGAAQKPMAGWSIYTATKAAVEIFTQSVAMEQETLEFPTTIFAFQPGKVETPMQKYVRGQKKEDLPTVDIFLQSHKENSNYTPEFVAKLLLKLLPDAKSGVVYKARELKEKYGM